MNPEENKRMLVPSCVVAELKEENIELVLHAKQLVIECNNVYCQSNGKNKRNGKYYSKQTFCELQKMGEQFDRLARKSGELERFAKAIHLFVEDKNLYMKKGASCWYKQVSPVVCSTSCLECVSCLGVIEGVGVICEKRLKDACVSFPAYE